MALLAFVDDTRFTAKSPAGLSRTWCGFGAVVVPDSGLTDLDATVEELKNDFGFPSRLPPNSDIPTIEEYREAKYSPGRRQWMRTNLRDQERQDFFSQALAILERLDGTIALSFYDESSDGCGEYRARERALKNLYERFDGIAEKKDAGALIVVCDFEGSNDDVRRLVHGATGIARYGTWYREKIKEKVYPVLLVGESHLHSGLQLADIATGVLRAMILDAENQHAQATWSEVYRRLFRRGNVAKGWGLKIRSKDIGRIYHALGI